MSRIPRLTSEQRADLVAYLDGELGEDEAREIEQVLTASEVARHEVEMLGRTWDLLETLPRENASAEFAAKTLATVQVATAKPPQQWQPKARRGLIALGWATALAASAFIGFAIGHRWLPRQDEPFVEQLPLIENLDAYQDAGSVEFLERLDQRRLTLRAEDGP